MDRARRLDEPIAGLAFQDVEATFDFAPVAVDLGAVELANRGSGAYVGDQPQTRHDPLGSSPEVAPPVEGGAAAVRTVYDGIKRAFDVVLCLVILPLVAPVAGIIAIMVRLDSTGPVIFRQTRIGRDGQPFQILKFRTLRADHDQQQDRAYMEAFIQGRTSEVGIEGEHVVNKPIDPVAVTRVGRVLRRTSLDELPQIVNVLNGEMSLVGPRPNVPWEVDAYLDWHRERLAAMPGITGLAQVRGRSCVTFDTIAAADIEYVRTRSPWLDAKILWQTVICIFTGDGAG